MGAWTLRVSRRLIVAVVAGMLGLSAAAAKAATPSDVIRSFNDTLLTVMQNADQLGYDGRYSTLDPAVHSAFDLQFMMNYAVTRHWAELTPEQQERLVDAFGRMTIATYANRFNDYSGERFEVLDEVPQRQGMTLVRSRIVDSGGAPISLNYLLRETPEGWRIVDVFYNGSISELATRRSEYTSVMQRDGYDGLTDRFHTRTAELADEARATP